MDKIIPVFDEILSSISLSDMSEYIPDITNYDLSVNYLLNNYDLISFDNSNHIISNHIVNLSNFINDFTNIFVDKTIHLTKDETYIDHTIIGDDIVAQVKE